MASSIASSMTNSALIWKSMCSPNSPDLISNTKKYLPEARELESTKFSLVLMCPEYPFLAQKLYNYISNLGLKILLVRDRRRIRKTQRDTNFIISTAKAPLYLPANTTVLFITTMEKKDVGECVNIVTLKKGASPLEITLTAKRILIAWVLSGMCNTASNTERFEDCVKFINAQELGRSSGQVCKTSSLPGKSFGRKIVQVLCTWLQWPRKYFA